jgi:hypothetical protein
MPRFIALPKVEPGQHKGTILSLSKTSTCDRRRQIDMLREIQASDPTQREVVRWCEDRGRASQPRIDGLLRLTGATIVTMDDASARAMESDLGGVELLKDRRIALLEPARRAMGTTRISTDQRWHLGAIGLPSTRRRPRRRAPKIAVAVMDSGIQADLAEFAATTITAFDFDPNTGEARRVYPSFDTHDHGTHVGALISGLRVGVNPGVDLVSAVVMPEGLGWLSTFIAGMEWVMAQPTVRVVNLSVGFFGYIARFQTMMETLLNVGVLPVAAVGNHGRGMSLCPGNLHEVVSVGATNVKGKVWKHSGSQKLVVNQTSYHVPTVVAPGEGIYSCVRDGSYVCWDGTSMAAPIVSGIASRLLQECPDISVFDLKNAIVEACKKLDVSPSRQGRGLVQVVDARAKR